MSEIIKTIRDSGFIDLILVSKQKDLKYKCKIVTADKHFKDMKRVGFLYEKGLPIKQKSDLV